MTFSRLRLFVSYRRSDSEASAGRLADALARQFGANRVFLDSARIPFGADFIRVVTDEIARADVVVVVIGPEWLDTAEAPLRLRLPLARASPRQHSEGAAGGGRGRW